MKSLAKMPRPVEDEEGEFLVEEVATPPKAAAAPARAQRRPKSAVPYRNTLPKVPTLAEVSPEYASLQEKRTAVINELARVERDISDTAAGLARAASETAYLQQVRVDAILDGEPGDLGKVKEQKEVLGRQWADLQERASDLKAALAEVERRLAVARGVASREVCHRIEPQYRELVLDMCDRLRDMHTAALAYQRLTDALTSQDIGWTRLGVMFPTFLGDPRDSQGRMALYFREAVRLGFLTVDDLPEEF